MALGAASNTTSGHNCGGPPNQGYAFPHFCNEAVHIRRPPDVLESLPMIILPKKKAGRCEDSAPAEFIEKPTREACCQLQAARRRQQFTQADLARLINEKVAVVTNLETCKEMPSAGVIAKIERALNIKLIRNRRPHEHINWDSREA